MFAIQLVHAVALGNGTRSQGEVLAVCEGCEPPDLCQAAAESTGRDLDQAALPGRLHLADGVEPIELLTALRNPRLLTFVDDAAADRPTLDLVPEAPRLAAAAVRPTLDLVPEAPRLAAAAVRPRPARSRAKKA